MRHGMTLARCIMPIAHKREEPATVAQEIGAEVIRGPETGLEVSELSSAGASAHHKVASWR